MRALLVASALGLAALSAAPATADPLAHCEGKVDVACYDNYGFCVVSYSLRCVNPL